MSDFQAWQGAWTADDAMYDYLNPEQLVLNRGGTSLTNSNLKLWYPMNEGHRGNQSYILDASNTGLGDDITVNGDFATGDLTGWTTGSGGSNGIVSYSNGGIRIQSDGDNAFFRLHDISGTAYKLVYDVIDISSTNNRLQIEHSSGSVNLPGTSVGDELGTNTYYFNADKGAGNYTAIKRSGSGVDVTLDNIKLYPINNKYNATTVFYGDEMVANGDCEVTDPTTVTISGVACSALDGTFDDSTDQANSSSKSIKITADSSSNYPGMRWVGGDEMSLIVGRTYYMECYVYMPSGGQIDRTQLKYRNNAGTTVNIGFTGTFDAWTKLSGTLTIPDDITDIQIIAYKVATGAVNNEFFYVDDISLKEVGVATGWTDADQQLDIPQTALQSYNQLAFSDDYRSGIALSDGGTTTHQITTNNHTWSFWMFRNQEDSDTFHYVLQKGKYQENGYYIYQTGGKLAFVTNTSGANQAHSTDATVPKGEWFHAAITIYSSGTASQWYINGQAESSVTGITAPVANTDYTSFYAYDSDNTPPPTTHPGYQCLTELSSWNKQLSEDEIQEIYNNGLALDCTTHSASANLVGYWRNNGLAEWEDLSTNNYHGTPTSITETMLITAGVDSSKDSQGFLMNKQRLTNSANIAVLTKQDGTNDEGSYIYLPDNPLYTGSAVTNYTISFWVKFAVNPTDLDHNMHFIDTNQSDANRTFKIHITSSGVIYLYTYYGSSASNESVYCDYGFPGKLGNAIQTPPVNANAGIGEAFDVNNWYHLTWTFDHDRTTGSGNADNTNSEDTNFTPYKMYVNGICVIVEGREGANSAMTTARSMQNANVPMIIGSDMGSDGTITETSYQDFPGELDDICFYSDTLTDEEVTRNYNAGKRSHR